ncbi:MAG TPA: PP2C family serine/threonine-protein phosphatase [Myxococcota bacterium]|nr:PP2C family serine/threonine-protein phosphatase [Myxococcota bacterium]
MEWIVASRSDPGLKRTVNEDFFAVDEKRGLFVVADGLGGHVAGRRASELGVGVFVETVAAEEGDDAPLALLRTAFGRANAAIRDLSQRDPQLRGMGTTLAALWLRGDEALLAHAGDSRLYLYRAGALHALTIDHSLVGERVARGELTHEQARVHPSRHVITRAVGVLEAVDPDLASLRPRAEDVFVLCSDGISSQLTDAEICDCLLECRSDLARASRELVDLANARGGEDNATVVLVAVTR